MSTSTRESVETGAELVARLRTLGVVLTTQGDRLRCSVPKHVLTAELRQALVARKSEIIAALEHTDDVEPLVVEPLARDAEQPLAIAQERLWFLHQLDPESTAYHMADAARVVGPLSLEALQHAWTTIAGRHDVLRTTFIVSGGRPVQRVAPAAGPVPIAVIDLRDLPESQRESVAVQRATEEVQRTFDLERGPLFHVAAVVIADDVHLLATSIHHLICDQWSFGVIAWEFLELYQAYLSGRPPRLPELPVQYGDYAIAHRQWLERPALSRQMAYWKRQLAGLELQELPADFPRVAGRLARGARAEMPLPMSLLNALRRLGSDERSTLFMVLIAAFQVVLARHTGQDDVTVGTPITNRPARNLERLIGTFVNTLVFRTDLSENPTFRELVRRVREVALDAFRNQHLSFERLVSEIQPQRVAQRTPLFQVLFNVQNAPLRSFQLPGIELTPVVLPRESTQFDLTVSIETELRGILRYSYNASLFEAGRIARFFEHYVAVLHAVARDPDVPIDTIELLGHTERDTVLHRWNDTTRPLPDETVVSLFERHAAQTPNRVAVVCGTEHLEYRELDARAARLASYLRARGAGAETLVGICLTRSTDLIVALLGILKSGAAYLPLDPTFPVDRLAYMVEDSGTRLVITEESLRDRLPAAAASLELICVDRDADAIAAAPPTRATPPGGDDLAYVLYTSGSTGRPKGVAIPHRALTNFLLSMQSEPGLSEHDRLLSVTTLSFDIAGLEIHLPLVTGARVVLAKSDEVTNPARLMALMQEEGITVMQATPATWRMLLDAGWQGHAPLTILCGGEAMPRELAKRLLVRGRALWNMYGPTETTIWSTVERIGANVENITIGRPIANTQVYVLDRTGNPAPLGVAGELYIGGAGVARGYLNRPELTAVRFVSNPFNPEPGARLYRTGDLARLRDDGRLECLGRLDHQVKLRGFRIELGEIEARLTTHADVQNAVAIVHEQGADGMLVAYVVPKAGATIDPAALRALLRSSLPPYMVPALVMPIEALPLTPNGKLHRAALPRPRADVRPPDASALPRTDVEVSLGEIWGEVLGVRAIGLDDDFFELGGHSLLAVQLMSAVEERFKRTLGLATLFEARTIRQLAEVLGNGRRVSQWTSLAPIKKSGTRPPFFCVHGVGGEVLVYSLLAKHMAPDQPFVAIKASGEEGVSGPAHTIEGQAAVYIREMLAYQPEGPYYIGGYSHGGRVALEMALQLEAMHKGVAFLGILDTTPQAPTLDPLTYLRRWLLNVPLWVRYDLLRTRWRQNLNRLQRAGRILARQIFSRRERPERQDTVPDISDVMKVDQLPPHIRRMYELDYVAYIKYRPSGKCRRTTVFRAHAQPLFGSHEPDLGWRAVSREPVDVRPVAGNHSSILAEPDVRALAAALSSALEEAQKESGFRAPVDLEVDGRRPAHTRGPSMVGSSAI